MKFFILIYTSVLLLSGCSDTSNWFSSAPCYYPDEPQTLAPGWVCGQSKSSAWLTSVGYAPASSAGAAFAKSMAQADARVKLAQRLKTQCAVGQISEALLNNSKLMNTQRSPSGGQYAQVGIRPADLQLRCK
ncbi:MAG: LPP20 family lipoprotein [Gammaproteobacteria bacterium]|nr:LPP20 family lipoprotein [Gammaproteobacteria bacterium]MBL6998714.1 LPP20 family lipoprotein [Gammaproteobacteria bacterium]